ncbi:MAG TPA: TOMM precursor leader peptide-binding protein, partial [Longimicrobium sp.]|nr:TOMM precursor leader peptide-binding protein [Longimicrobium sp.]
FRPPLMDLTRPTLRAHFRAEVMDERHVLLLSETGDHLLTGEVYARLAPLLDGTRSTAQLVREARERATPAEVHYAVDRLSSRGYLREAAPGIPAPAQAFWDALGADPAATAARLESATATVHALGSAGGAAVGGALRALGVRVRARGGADLEVVLVDDYLHPGLAAVNRRALRRDVPWLLARPAGLAPWIGPLFVPGETACWRCLARRLEGNRAVAGLVRRSRGLAEPVFPPAPALEATAGAAAQLVAAQAARWLALGRGDPLTGALAVLDPLGLSITHHPLRRRPQCPECGSGGARREPEPVVLRPCPARYSRESGHRAQAPAQTLERLAHLVSPITGVVAGLARAVPESAALVPVYAAGRNTAKATDDLHFLRNNFRGQSGGKGVTDAQARASALCEAIERHCGVFEGDEPRRRATLVELGEAAVHPNASMLFSDAQYATRDAWNARHGKSYQWVPHRFDPDRPVEWSPLWSMGGECWRYLPTALCYYGYPLATAERFGWADSNGCAAGNTREEAILQGFLELVERDAVAVWWYNRLRRPAVELESFDDPYFAAVRGYYRSLGRELWALDLTADLGIPVFAAVSGRTGGHPPDLTLGFGAHLDPAIALQRAVTEANQFLPVVLPRHADPPGPFGTEDDEALAWLGGSTLANRPYLAPDPDLPARRAQDFAAAPDAAGDIADQVRRCVALAAARGMDTLVLDQGRADVELAVVKVVVPGLRHFWARYAPGRLYDVPVRLGWLPAPLAEDQLNPVPVFF